MDDINDLTRNDLAKLDLPDKINDAVCHLMREISCVGALGIIPYEEGRADGFCFGLRLAGVLDETQEQALKKLIISAIFRRKRELRPS